MSKRRVTPSARTGHNGFSYRRRALDERRALGQKLQGRNKKRVQWEAEVRRNARRSFFTDVRYVKQNIGGKDADWRKRQRRTLLNYRQSTDQPEQVELIVESLLPLGRRRAAK